MTDQPEPTLKDLQARAEAIGVPNFRSHRNKAELAAAIEQRETTLRLSNVDPENPAAVAAFDQVQELRNRILQLEAQQASSQPAEDPEKARRAAAKAFDGWPRKGYDGPQPWDVAQMHAEDRHHGDQPDPYTGPGAVTHAMPSLTFGAAGEPVRLLGNLLYALGYRSNTLARGENPNGVLDNSVMNDVMTFANEHGVTNDIREFQGLAQPAHEYVNRVVGPYIWQALIEAAARREAELSTA